MIEKIDNSETNDNNVLIITDHQLNTVPDLPICVTVVHNGFWITTSDGIHTSTTDKTCDRNIVILNPTSMLYVYKLALRHLLLSKQIIPPAKIDNQNLVPHIVVRKDKNSQNQYDAVQSEKFIINEKSLSVKSDFLLIELDEDRDLHMTLIYCKKIRENKEKINLIDAFKTVIRVLNAYPELTDKYRKLPYFGQSCIQYWYDVPDSFPFNIEVPVDYKHVDNKIDTNNFAITSAGSILKN